jgi:hypothetical protein
VTFPADDSFLIILLHRLSSSLIVFWILSIVLFSASRPLDTRDAFSCLADPPKGGTRPSILPSKGSDLFSKCRTTNSVQETTILTVTHHRPALLESGEIQLLLNASNKLVPRVKAILAKPTFYQPVKKYATFCGARRFITALTKGLHWAK